MRYNEPYGGVADAPYVNGDPSIGLQGSIPPAASIEFDQREIVHVIQWAFDNGYVSDDIGTLCEAPANTDLQQLRKAIYGFGKANQPPPLSKESFGSVYMSVVGGLMTLSPQYGATLFVIKNSIGALRPVPNPGGITLAASGTLANTLYYIYANWTGSALVLSYDTVAPVADATFGHMRKTGNAEYTYVGLSWVTSNGAWQSAAQYTASHYNARPRVATATEGTGSSTSSTSYIEIATTRVTFVTDDGYFFGAIQSSVAAEGGPIANTSAAPHIALSVDAVTPYGVGMPPRIHNEYMVGSTHFGSGTLSRGKHYAAAIVHSVATISFFRFDNTQTMVITNG